MMSKADVDLVISWEKQIINNHSQMYHFKIVISAIRTQTKCMMKELSVLPT